MKVEGISFPIDPLDAAMFEGPTVVFLDTPDSKTEQPKMGSKTSQKGTNSDEVDNDLQPLSVVRFSKTKKICGKSHHDEKLKTAVNLA